MKKFFLIQDNNINYKILLKFSVFFNILSMHFVDHSIIYEISAVLFLGIIALEVLSFMRIRMCVYTILEILFILLNVFYLYAGLSLNYPDVITSRLTTLTINLIINIAYIHFFRKKENIKFFFKSYLFSAILFFIYLILINPSGILSGRLGWDVKQIFGKGLYHSNNIAFISSMAYILSIYYYYENKQDLNKRRYFLFSIVFCASICFLTGTRKSLFVLAFATVLYLFLMSKSITKKLKIFIVSLTLIILCYFILTKIPVFYNIIGWRLNELINMFLGVEVNDNSAITRERLKDLAIYQISLRPWTGYGLDTFHLDPKSYGLYTHSDYLEILHSSGIFGAIIYYSGYLLALIKSWIIHKSENNLGTVLFIIVCSLLIQGIGQVSYFNRFIMIFLVCAASLPNKNFYNK